MFQIFSVFANIFGFVLNFINGFVGNYGLAIILFTLLIKLLMLPLSIKQQRTMKKNSELQKKMKVIQFKYKNDQEKLNSEIMKLYKEEKMSPFSGCFSAIIQMVLLLSIFYMVRCPLTYMERVDTDHLSKYVQQLQEAELPVNNAYSEIDIIRNKDILIEKNPDDVELKNINFNMNFFGLDLSKIPQQNLNDWTVYIIPILYIISTFISIRITTAMQKNKNDVEKLTDGFDSTKVEDKSQEKEEKGDMEVAMEQSNKMMSWMMPIMAVSISTLAPLGLALYWLVNNILMIGERLVLNKVIKD